ncbi:hypothetical protein C0995_008798 [Termitomyces sp. Mi166|nr:hypothetical protein C0995_008798 [Termitomyces sp. Mi166\
MAGPSPLDLPIKRPPTSTFLLSAFVNDEDTRYLLPSPIMPDAANVRHILRCAFDCPPSSFLPPHIFDSVQSTESSAPSKTFRMQNRCNILYLHEEHEKLFTHIKLGDT